MEEYKIKAYAKVDSNNVIKEINNNIFIRDLTGWLQIDEGNGEKFAHAQSQYLGKSLMDVQFRYNYKLVDGKVVELTEEEKEILFPTQKPVPSDQELFNAQLLKANAEQQTLNASLVKQLAELKGGITNV